MHRHWAKDVVRSSTRLDIFKLTSSVMSLAAVYDASSIHVSDEVILDLGQHATGWHVLFLHPWVVDLVQRLQPIRAGGAPSEFSSNLSIR